MDESTLFDLARNLLSQIVAEGNVWPCANLSLSVGGFEDGITGNMGIGSFLIKGEAAQALRSGSREGSQPETERPERTTKRRRVEDVGIQRFFVKKQMSEASDQELGSDDVSPMDDGDIASTRPAPDSLSDAALVSRGPQAHQRQPFGQDMPITDYVCSRCYARFETAAEDQSHKDWHFAKDLQDQEERVSSAFANRPSASASASASMSGNMARKGPGASPKRAGRPKKTEPGQSKLKFG
jgi:DNA polymerase eta